jgi:hypothetical protein
MPQLVRKEQSDVTELKRSDSADIPVCVKARRNIDRGRRARRHVHYAQRMCTRNASRTGSVQQVAPATGLAKASLLSSSLLSRQAKSFSTTTSSEPAGPMSSVVYTPTSSSAPQMRARSCERITVTSRDPYRTLTGEDRKADSNAYVKVASGAAVKRIVSSIRSPAWNRASSERETRSRSEFPLILNFIKLLADSPACNRIRVRLRDKR